MTKETAETSMNNSVDLNFNFFSHSVLSKKCKLFKNISNISNNFEQYIVLEIDRIFFSFTQLQSNRFFHFDLCTKKFMK